MLIAAKNVETMEHPGARSGVQTNILKVLAYFDIFQYPLTIAEIRQFLGSRADENDVEHGLQKLVSDQVIFYHQGFYSLQDNTLLTYRRREGNWRAGKLLPKAYKIGRFLYRFPFVRGVCISGSLSKNFADENADIDFFIITRANRLWITRTIMHLFKKLTFLTGHQHYFCMNYYIDEEALLISEQNIYTALEIATLIPVAGKQTNENFFRTNSWVARFFPACRNAYPSPGPDFSTGLKSFVEGLLSGGFSDRLDRWLMNITTRRWAKKSRQNRLNKNGQTMKLLTGRHFSKSNPGSFQERVLSLYEQKLAELGIER